MREVDEGGTLTFNETRMQAKLEPRRGRVSRLCGPQSARKDNHSVEIHREGWKTDALAPGQNADYKCMPVAL